jgi:DNA polymerase III subunit epsilon
VIFERPLFLFDLETTGIDPLNDRICQFSFKRIHLNHPVVSKTRLIDPTVPIPAEATACHRITDEMVKGQPQFHQIAKSLLSLMEGCDLGGYNVANFDIQLLWEEFHRAGIWWDYRKHRHLDALAIWRKMMPRKLKDAIREFCGEEVDDNTLHDASVDVGYTGDVLEAQFARWPSLTVDQAAAFSQEPIIINGVECERLDLAGVIANYQGVPVFTHRKVRGLPVCSDRKYAGWILKGDFSENTKEEIRHILNCTPVSIPPPA